MESIGRLAGGIAHDFNNLLTVILGRSELLLRRLPANDENRRDIELIQNTAERAAMLTRQLLQFSRQQVLQPKVLDLNAIVSEVEKLLHRLIGEHIEVMLRLSPKLSLVKADPGQLQQVMMNLAVNARDAMPNGGKLIIETQDVELDEEYARKHAGVIPGIHVMLAVSDNGVGMDDETSARIFEPFFTTKEQGKGTGLGLSTVYGIIKQSGGNIWVYSEPGRGTTFKIYLPRASELSPAEKTSSFSLRAVQQGNETILLVEDEPGVRELVAEILSAIGYTVLSASNGDEAIEMSQRHNGTIHLLITDVIMPEMSGRELANRISAVRPDTRVLYITGYTSDAILHHGVLDEKIALLEKPFTPASIARKVREVLDK